MSDVAVTVEVIGLRGEKINQNDAGLASSPIKFDVNVKLEERERQSGRITVGFSLVVATKPSVVKYELDGIAILNGKDDLLGKILETDPETKVPFIPESVSTYLYSYLPAWHSFRYSLSTPRFVARKAYPNRAEAASDQRANRRGGKTSNPLLNVFHRTATVALLTFYSYSAIGSFEFEKSAMNWNFWPSSFSFL